jgi:hypothetical protein
MSSWAHTWLATLLQGQLCAWKYIVKKCGSIEAAWRVTFISPCILRIPGINGIMRKEKASHGSSLHHHSALHLHSSPPPYQLLLLLLLSHQCKEPEKKFCQSFDHGRRITINPWQLLSLSLSLSISIAILTIQEHHHKETKAKCNSLCSSVHPSAFSLSKP